MPCLPGGVSQTSLLRSPPPQPAPKDCRSPHGFGDVAGVLVLRCRDRVQPASLALNAHKIRDLISGAGSYRGPGALISKTCQKPGGTARRKGKSGEGKPSAWGRMDLSSLTPPQSPPWSQQGTSRLAEQILPP